MAKTNNAKHESANTESPEVPQPDATSELTQLRKIVFGAAEQRLVEQITLTREQLQSSLKDQEDLLSGQIKSLGETVEQHFTTLTKKIDEVDNQHNDNHQQHSQQLSSLNSELEMLAASSQDELKELEASVERENQRLSSHFTEQLEQLKTYLEDVSKELSSSKTDRKTLAKLLAAMATNLEDDQL